jgi:hypothetical protein
MSEREHCDTTGLSAVEYIWYSNFRQSSTAYACAERWADAEGWFGCYGLTQIIQEDAS